MFINIFPKIKVFISSKHTELNNERQFIEIICKQWQLEVFRLPENTTAGSSPGDFRDLLQKSDIMILLIGEEASDYVDEEIKIANDEGIPIIPLLKIIDKPGSKGISEIAKFYRDVIGKEWCKEYLSLNELYNNLILSLQRFLENRFNAQYELKNSNKDIYTQAKYLVSKAYQRLLIVQKSSSLILGNRRGNHKEIYFIDEIERKLTAKISKNVIKPIFVFLYIFSIPETQKEWESGNYPEKIKRREWFLKFIREKKDKDIIHIAGVQKYICSAMVSDFSYGISIEFIQRLFTFGYEQPKIANQIFNLARDICDEAKDDTEIFLNEILPSWD